MVVEVRYNVGYCHFEPVVIVMLMVIFYEGVVVLCAVNLHDGIMVLNLLLKASV